MKPSIKAALISALVFPGLGHFTLKHPLRGCLFLAPAAVAAFYLARQMGQRAGVILEQLDAGTLALAPKAIADQLAATASPDGPMVTIAVMVAMVCWVASIIDSFLIRE